MQEEEEEDDDEEMRKANNLYLLSKIQTIFKSKLHPSKPTKIIKKKGKPTKMSMMHNHKTKFPFP
jgi:hypothetical protein